ncbi:MAG: hypothetical protein JWM10_3085, partial [Myxococcaceae bacterium]|nr:hypothetical protein [Myxococcaceae bacterium]
DATGRAWVLRVAAEGAELARFGCAPPRP